MARGDKPMKDRLLDKVQVDPETGCWVWQGAKDQDGYGKLNIRKHWVRAHRVSYEFFKGPIPKGMCICHHCDNRPCIHPGHLFTGSPRVNALDRTRKGRSARLAGERNPSSKLTGEQVEQIRRLKGQMSQGKIARLFNVSPGAVHLIHTGKTWRKSTSRIPQNQPYKEKRS